MPRKAERLVEVSTSNNVSPHIGTNIIEYKIKKNFFIAITAKVEALIAMTIKIVSGWHNVLAVGKYIE